MSIIQNREYKLGTEPWMQVIIGAFALFIAMSVGRFAYTPILPLMQAQAHFSDASAGYLASSNYVGYLIGAFAAGSVTWIRRRRLYVYRWSLIVSILANGLMTLTSSLWVWSVIRTISGISSALVFVLISSIVLDVLAMQNRSKLSGVLYGGVGFGIAVTGLVVPAIGSQFGWRGEWLGLMVLSIVIGIPTTIWTKDLSNKSKQQSINPENQIYEQKKYFPWLVLAYGCEGFGYIITGTFLVEMASKMPTLHGYATYSWVVVGVAALPSTILWAYLAHRYGDIPILVTAYLLQALGVMLPVLLPTEMGVFLGSIFFGGTFLGITSVGTMLGRKLRPQDSSKAIGLMTGIYGIGQILGAAGAGLLADHLGGFDIPTLAASGIILVGAAVLLFGKFTVNPASITHTP